MVQRKPGMEPVPFGRMLIPIPVRVAHIDALAADVDDDDDGTVDPDTIFVGSDMLPGLGTDFEPETNLTGPIFSGAVEEVAIPGGESAIFGGVNIGVFPCASAGPGG